MNIYEKIQAVSLEIRNIEKSLTVGSGSYSYKAVSDLDVTLSVKDAEAKFKIISIPTKQELINSEVIKSIKKDNSEGLTFVDTIKMTVKIIDLDKPTDFIEIEAFGKGIDSGDKGFGKASTYARKYALLNAYKIATGEDPDAEKSTETKVPNTPSEKRVIVENIASKDAILSANICKHYGVEQINQITEEQISVIYKSFKEKGKI